MHICLIIDNPETPHHPIIASVVQKLSAAHCVRMLDVRQRTGAQALAEEEQHTPADLYLLKSHVPQALEVAQALEQRGALLVNSYASTLACQDRVLLSQRMEEVGLPWPRSMAFPSLAHLLAQDDLLATLSFPLIVKSRYSRRGDLVAKVGSSEQLRSYLPQWSQEPIVLQQFMAGDGWDIKMWVIDEQIFAARRRTPLAGEGKKDYPIGPDELPEAWARIAREIGRAFQLRLYGVDLLVSESGPVIVDVNSFPGFRGVPGADDALAQLVERIGQESQQGHTDGATTLSINDLPAVVRRLCERAGLLLLPGARGPVDLFVRYLRRKPERGLAVIYHVDERHAGGRSEQSLAHDAQSLPTSRPPGYPQGVALPYTMTANEPEHSAYSRATPLRVAWGESRGAWGESRGAWGPERAVSLTLAESALDGARIRFNAQQVEQAELQVTETGILQATEPGLSLQAFPADAALPTLAACCDTTPQGQLWQELQKAAWQQLGDARWQLIAAVAQPVRYKPGSRCVIRYRLTVRQEGDEGQGEQKALAIFGKVYADAEQARNVQAMMQALYAEQAGQSLPFLPEPLGVSDIPGLVFNEAVESGEDGPENRVRTGNECFRFQAEYGRGGAVSRVIVPEEELRLTARALAQLHTSALVPGKKRIGVQEARRARERAALLAGHSPAQANEVLQLAQRLSAALEAQQPPCYRPAHGGFKPSQLLFHSHCAFVVDFDGLCLADAALDIGYFLAYLRPASLWYHRPGTRQWFEESAALFTDAYREAMRARAIAAQEIEDSIRRAKLYEAALLFKIATRRVNRLNSPRPGELAAMLDEVARCLSLAQQER
jgi:glutathione synthase/RimK-type ligase-like ATP-grasp enzyme/Tfp pilus assembly protein PilX